MSGDSFTKSEQLQWKKRIAAPDPGEQFRCDILDIDVGQCRYIIDTVNGQFCCGAPSEKHDSRWCLYHAGWVYQGREFFTAPELLQEAA